MTPTERRRSALERHELNRVNRVLDENKRRTRVTAARILALDEAVEAFTRSGSSPPDEVR